MSIRRLIADGNRVMFWPVRVSVSHWQLGWHAWQAGAEPSSRYVFGFMPGWRGVYGHTISAGWLRVSFGVSWVPASGVRDEAEPPKETP